MAMFAIAAATAGMQMYSGLQQSRESKYNASLYSQQANIIDAQKRIEAGQYDRAGRQLAGTTMANAAKSGLGFGGSSLAVLIDSMTQLEMDKSIGQYNLEVDKRYSQATADAYKRQAKAQRTTAFTNAFTTLLSGAYDYSGRAGAMRSDPTGRVGWNTGTRSGTSNYPGGYRGMAF